MILIRSLVFQALFYTSTLLLMVLSLPVFVLPARWGWPVVPLWARVNLWLLRWVAGVKVEFRGLENIPDGGCIVAAKHQSAWETFALLPLFRSPTYVLKRELRYIPLFGWYTAKFRQIPVDRGKRSVALAKLTDSAKTAISEGRQILIFPEGTRRGAGEEPRYKYGVSHLYKSLACPLLPVALNSGVYWPRRGWKIYPGTVVTEFLPVIAPGEPLETAHATLVNEIETASDRLILEAARSGRPLPVLDRVRERWAARGKSLD
jgi:1-acyl-sn-glycerol-3-phosphate acyltransferase